MASRPGTTPAARPGVTFIEVVLSMALLGLAAATLASVTGYVTTAQRRAEATLGAAEVANRVILQYLINPDRLPPGGIPIEYLGAEYHWEISASELTLEDSPELEIALADSPSRNQSGPLALGQRMERVVATAWLAETSGGSVRRDDGAPQASLVRIADRLNFSRNPAIRRELLEQGESGIQTMMDRIMGSTGFSRSSGSSATSTSDDDGGER